MTWSSCLRLATFLLVLGARPVVADVTTCLNETGYAFQDSGTAALLDGGIVRPFPSAFSSCDPPIEGLVNIGDEGGAVLLDYAIGFGLQTSTAALASPSVSGTSEGRVNFAQYFSFTVVPDDPGSAGTIPITITARHSFGGVAASSNGFAFASNGHVTRYQLWSHFVGGPEIVPTWNSEGFVAQANESFDLIQDADAPTDLKLFLLATLQQRSSAVGSSGSNPGSGSAQLASTITYEVSTEADASIVFDLETLLGYPPPALDVVSVPEPDPMLLQLGSLMAIGIASRARRWPQHGARHAPELARAPSRAR